MTALKGVVLAGGRSSRMGSDKAGLSMCGDGELARVVGMLEEYCAEVWVSVRPEQAQAEAYRGFRRLTDPPGVEGPIAGIVAAFDRDPGSAWLSIAVDMPYVGAAEIALLSASRRPGAEAICFYNREIEGPEPLLTLFEPEFRPRLESFIGSGKRGLYGLLRSSPVYLLEPVDESALKSMNTPDDYRYAQEALCYDE